MNEEPQINAGRILSADERRWTQIQGEGEPPLPIRIYLPAPRIQAARGLALRCYRRPKLWNLPAAIAWTPLNPETCTGVKRSIVVPSPS